MKRLTDDENAKRCLIIECEKNTSFFGNVVSGEGKSVGSIMDNVDAVVLAGGINRIELFEGYELGYKSLLLFGGKPLIQYTLDALRAVPQVKRVCIVGPETELRQAVQEASSYDFAQRGETLMDSVFCGLRHFCNSPIVLFISADMPLITHQAITDFLETSANIETNYDRNIFWSVVPERFYTGPYEKSPKGFNRFKDIAVCHGNLMLTEPQLLKNTRTAAHIDDVYRARKSSIKAALAIGWRAGLSYLIGVHLLHILTLEQMARIVSKRLGVGLIPVLLKHPEITIDVDEPEDYAFVKNLLEA
jgi:molybdopterin-guanine dinucleotide biosynthesis protein A